MHSYLPNTYKPYLHYNPSKEKLNLHHDQFLFFFHEKVKMQVIFFPIYNSHVFFLSIPIERCRKIGKALALKQQVTLKSGNKWRNVADFWRGWQSNGGNVDVHCCLAIQWNRLAPRPSQVGYLLPSLAHKSMPRSSTQLCNQSS